MRVHREIPLFKGQAGFINSVYTYSIAYTSHTKFSFLYPHVQLDQSLSRTLFRRTHDYTHCLESTAACGTNDEP